MPKPAVPFTLQGGVEALRRCPDEAKFLGIFDRDFGRHRQLARGIGETAIAQRALVAVLITWPFSVRSCDFATPHF